MMLTGAALGFGVGITFSLLRQSTWPTVIWHACVAAYVAGMLFRWWGRHWTKNLRLALVEKQAAAVKEALAQPAPGAVAPATRVASAGLSTASGPSKR
ncbi:MAG: hypothetical protein JNL97_14700 [Verrucomicrobiales bacterium]|nr:hypothetical protein [Verrucomicrobiales bacterium]